MKDNLKELPEVKQVLLEQWADNKKKTGMTDDEKLVVGAIDHFNRFGWPEVANKKKITTKEEALEELEKLKRKVI